MVLLSYCSRLSLSYGAAFLPVDDWSESGVVISPVLSVNVVGTWTYRRAFDKLSGRMGEEELNCL